MRWFRVWHGYCASPKWTLVAARAGCPKAEVIAVSMYLMELASEAEDRGSIEGFDLDECEVVTGVTRDSCDRIVTEMNKLSRSPISGNRFKNWEKFQPKDSTAAERKRRQRDRERQEKQGGIPGDGTLRHGHDEYVTRDDTPITDSEQTREDKESPQSPPRGERPPDVDWMVKDWNELAPSHGLPAVQRLTDQRRRTMRKRLTEDFDGEPERYRAFVRRVVSSPHLTGGNDRNWRADFDWCLKPANLTKIVEGNYDRRKPAAPARTNSSPRPQNPNSRDLGPDPYGDQAGFEAALAAAENRR